METVTLSAREVALSNGSITYIHDKLCKHQHEPVRYASTGQCVACVKGKVDHYRNIKKSANSAENALRADGLVQTPFFRWRDQSEFVNKLQAIIAQRGQRLDELVSFVNMIGSATLSRMDLLLHLHVDLSGRVTNFNDFDHRTGDSGRPETCIRGEWYLDQELQDLIDRKTICVEALVRPKPGKEFRDPYKAGVTISTPPRPPAPPPPPVDEYSGGALTDADRRAIAELKAEFGDD